MCEVQSKEDAKTQQKRKKLEKDVEEFMKNPSVTRITSPDACTRVENLVSDLMSTYNTAAYQDLPRLTPIDLQSWVVMHHLIMSQLSKCLAATTALFKLLGFAKVILTETGIELVPGKNSTMHIGAAMALGLIGKCLREKKKIKAADEYAKEYEKWYLVVNGAMDGSAV